MLRKLIAITLFALLVFTQAGCILERSTMTLYLEADGSVTWRVLRDVIRSDHDDPAARLAEEGDHIEKLEGGGDFAEILDGLGATTTSTTILRARRPFTVLVEGRFESIQQLTEGLLLDNEGDVEFDVTDEGPLRTITFVMQLERKDCGDDDACHPWSYSGDAVEVVAAQGRFVETTGYELSRDGVIATPIPYTDDELDALDGRVVLQVVWDLEA